MVKKLKRRFIIVIMSIFTIILVGVFAALYISMVTSAQRASMMTLRKIAEFGGMSNRPIVDFQNDPPETSESGEMPEPPDIRETSENPDYQNGSGRGNSKQHLDAYEGIDSITVKYDSNGNIFEVISLMDTGDDIDNINKSVLPSIISSGKSEGTVSISGISYRYYNADRDYGGILVMAPRTQELSTQRRLIILSIVFGIVGMAAMFLISIALAKWVAHPIAEAWNKQQQFVADASHELKTPLTVISASLDIITSGSSNTVESQKKWIDNIRSESERMRQLITDLLTLAKMDAGQETGVGGKTADLSTVSLSDIVCDSCLSFESVVFESGKRLDYDGVEDGISIKGSENALHRLIAIFLDNALKNSDNDGLITVTLKKVKNEAELTCSNTGHGIPHEAIDKIFERFYRADDSRNRETGGFGLGLAIAKSIAGEHGAKISVESIQDKLTSFTVKFPIY